MDAPKTPESSSTPQTPAASGAQAGDLAAQALKAAQEAVSSLKQEAGLPGEPAAGAVPSATLEAAQAAIAHAKAANNDGAGAQPGGSEGRTTTPRPFALPNFGASGSGARPGGLDLLADVNLNVKIELGRTRMLVEDVLRLGEGSVVELDKLAGDPVDVYVNERHVARGEVLVLNDNFCVRINEIVSSVGDQIAAR